MNLDADQNAPNAPGAATPPDPVTAPAPRAAAPTTAAPASGGLNSALKVAAPLVVLVGVVFAVTFLLQNAPTEVENTDGGKGKGAGGPPLRFFTSERVWDPPRLRDETTKDERRRDAYREFPLLAPSIRAMPGPDEKWPVPVANRVFQGVYEQSTTTRAAQFWFENPNPSTVTLQLKGVSCSQCSQGKLIPITPAVTKNLLHHTAISALPIGAFNPYGISLVRSFAELDELRREAPAQEFAGNPNAKFQVPPAAGGDKWAPQWGILELGFRVTGDPDKEPQKTLEAFFAVAADGTPLPATPNSKFVIAFEVAKPCEVFPASVEVGKLDQLSGDQTREFHVFSATRGPGSEFGDLHLTAGDVLPLGSGGAADPHKFVEVLKVQRVPDADLGEFEQRLAADRKRFARVRAAYRVAVVVRPKVGEHRMDIGAIDRTLSVTAGGVVHQLRVNGLIRGAVRLDDDRTDIELREFKGRDGTRQEFDLVTEKAGVAVAVVKDECTPKYYTYELLKQPDRGGQGYYKLKITVPGGQQFGREKGEVVLEVKGPTPQRIRIPVRASGTF